MLVAGAAAVAVVVLTADEAATPPATTEPATATTAPPTTEAPTTTIDDDAVSVFELEVGSCFDVPVGTDEVVGVAVVDCDTPHDAEVFAILRLDDTDFPGDEAIATEARDGCLEPFAEFIGRPWVESTIDYRWLAPTERSWTDGDREIICFATDPDGPVTGSLAGADR